jgi:hypothetical protein
MTKWRNRNDEGASLIIVLGLVGGLLTMVAALLPYAQVNIMSSAKFKTHVDSSYVVDGSLKMALTGVRYTARGSSPCAGFPKPLNNMTVSCSSPTIPSAVTVTTSGGASPGVTPSQTISTLYPGQSTDPIAKTVVAPTLPYTTLSGFQGCNELYATKNSPTITFAFGPSEPRRFKASDVGVSIWISKNGSCSGGGGGASGDYYTITAVDPATQTVTLNIPYQGNQNGSHNWKVTDVIQTTVTPSLVTNSSCPSTIFTTTFGPITQTGQTFSLNETLSVPSGTTAAISASPYQYKCDVQFVVTGSTTSAVTTTFTYVESNYISINTSTLVYFTASDSSTGVVKGRASATYNDSTTSRVPTITSWHLL